jgi:hypothetical protein
VEPAVEELHIEPGLRRLSIRLQHAHFITIDTSTFFSTIKVDDVVIVKKVNLDGLHAFELRDGNRILQGAIQPVTNWRRILRVVIKINGEVLTIAKPITVWASCMN